MDKAYLDKYYDEVRLALMWCYQEQHGAHTLTLEETKELFQDRRSKIGKYLRETLLLKVAHSAPGQPVRWAVNLKGLQELHTLMYGEPVKLIPEEHWLPIQAMEFESEEEARLRQLHSAKEELKRKTIELVASTGLTPEVLDMLKNDPLKLPSLPSLKEKQLRLTGPDDLIDM